MLIEKKIKLSETLRTKTDVNVSGAVYDNGVITITAPNHNIVPGTDLYFERSCGDGEVFIKKFTVNNVVDKDTFKIEYNLDNFLLSPNSIRKVSEILTASGSVEDYLLVSFDNNHKHICCEDRSGVSIRSFYNADYTFGPSAETCVSEYDTLFNGVSYYRTNTIDAEGNRVLDKVLNITDHYVWFVDDSGSTRYLGCAFVPFSPNNYDNRNLMYFEWNDEVQYLYENFVSKALFCLDCRFFNLSGISALTDEITMELAKGTSVYMYPSSLNLQIGLSDDFKLNLVHEDDVESYLVERQQANVSDIIDFEKRMFEPTYVTTSVNGNSIIDENNIKALKSVRFNVFLRDRVYDSETGEWSAPDENGWYSLETGNTLNNRAVFKTKLQQNSDKGDLLGSLGFDDDDVINQSKRLNKTFIRLSFYDTPNRATQTLLFYSTIFINTSKQYAKYMRNVASNSKIKDSLHNKSDSDYYPEYVRTANDNDDLALCTNFMAFDKFNMSGSSEGFYLYLFPDIVNGAEITELYMKVELNHAKYGKTIPLICPLNENGEPEMPRNNYLKKDNTYGNFIDLEELYNDMYIKVCVKRDYTNNRYVWFLPYVSNDNELVINLYEPRINDKVNNQQ